jgi:Na+/H+ antiporter NhaD/arsenite permease-like protein
MNSIIILLIVFTLIAVRQIGNIRLRIWQIMLFGALVVLLTGQISPLEAFKSIDADVMLFLFGMFIVGQALEDSGYLAHISYRLFSKVSSVNYLIFYILFGMGIASSFLMNDTLAIIGTPVVLMLSKQKRINPKLLLVALAFSVTIGSVMSPIGNPQNLLIALNVEMPAPFITFFKFLFIPTMLNLLLAFVLLKLFFKDSFSQKLAYYSREPIKDPELATISKISLGIMLVLIGMKIITAFLDYQIDFRLTYIALVSGFIVLIFSRKRFGIIKTIDWHTLIFFASMFILMKSVWNDGFFQNVIAGMDINVTSTGMILFISVIMSQFISNVPLVALYLPVLVHSGASTPEMIALAAGSTIAGNVSILGAASNVIIIQNAEKRTGDSITFFDFAKIGVPLTICNIAIYWYFLK